jgi:alkylated DNA repair protein alkB family protein 6
MIEQPLPPFIGELCDALVDAGIFGPGANERPNHCLLNEYTVGQGIAPHMDGPRYLPRAAILSVGSPATLRFLRRGSDGQLCTIQSVCLMPRSLLVFTGTAYTDLYHGIDSQPTDLVEKDCINARACGLVQGETIQRGKRWSLTIRRAKTDGRSAPESVEGRAELMRRRMQWIDAVNEGATNVETVP